MAPRSHHAFGDAAAGDLADLGDVEHLQDLGIAEEGLAQRRRQHARHRRLHVVHEVVDDVVVADLDAGALGSVARLLVGAHVEADDDGAFEASASVTSDSVMPPTPAWMTRAATSSVPSFSSAPTIASTEPCTSPLMTSGNSLRPAVLELAHHLLERAARAGCRAAELLAPLALAVFGDLAGAGLVLDDGEAVAGLRRAVEAEHLDRRRRAGRLDVLALVVDQRAHAAPFARRRRRCRRRCSVPRCTSTVATGPRPRSSLASIDRAFGRRGPGWP